MNYKQLLQRYAFYLLRWQLSTPILAPVVAYFKHSPSVWGTREDWIGSTVANLIGGLIFFWVDRWIFYYKAPIWEVAEEVRCVDCSEVRRGYRLVKTKNYDRSDDPQPEFRCEACSIKKYERIKEDVAVK